MCSVLCLLCFISWKIRTSKVKENRQGCGVNIKILTLLKNTILPMLARPPKQWWVFDMLSVIEFQRNSTMKVLSIFPFYSWGNWGTEAVMKWQAVERMISRTLYWPTLSKFCGKGHSLSRMVEKQTQFQLSLTKRRNAEFYLDLPRNILDVSYALFHLILKKEHSQFIDE